MPIINGVDSNAHAGKLLLTNGQAALLSAALGIAQGLMLSNGDMINESLRVLAMSFTIGACDPQDVVALLEQLGNILPDDEEIQ